MKHTFVRETRTIYNDKRVNSSRDIMIINTYIPNNKTLMDTKPKLAESKGEIDNSLITVGDFAMQLSIVDKTPRQKINKKTVSEQL